ncbi:AMP-binding protein [Sphaerimonospora mesophila]|uniref:AMP-binding protein n=1 Tax=Sphaerimonospora mesophila TaxID=37483 RepID=UPI0006E20E2D
MAELLAARAADRGDEIALADETGSRTWRELDERVDRWISAFAAAGLEVGDRVAFFLGNRIETYEALLACMHTGLVAVPVNWRLTPGEIAYIIDDSGARALITESVHAETAARAVAEATAPVPVRICVDARRDGFEPLDRLPAAPPPEPLSGAVLLYTSGTSGRPKGVVNARFKVGAPVSHTALGAAKICGGLGIPAEGRALLAGPWYHSAQIFFSLYPLLNGCSLIMRRRFEPVEVLELIDRERISISHLVPIQFIRMLRAPERAREAFGGASLLRIWHGGAPCPPDVKRAMIDWWGPVFTEYYAATEAGIVTLIDSETWLKKPGSVGTAVPPNEVVIVGDDGAALPYGQEGRVGIHRSSGAGFSYHRAPDKTAGAFVAPDTFTVGDVGHLDEDGFLFLTARSVEIIVSGGVNIYPAEVEAALLRHAAVRDAAVLGIPDAEFGERVKAVVQIEPGAEATAAELDRHCRDLLAGFKVPRSYDFVEELPREPTGKLARARLRELYWSGEGRRI